MRDELSELQSSYKTTNENCKLMEEKRDFYKKESEWTKRQNIKLKGMTNRVRWIDHKSKIISEASRKALLAEWKETFCR